MVAVPRVKNGLAFPVRYASRLVERGLGVVGFAERMFVQGLKVDGASRLAVLFLADYHAVTPCHRRTDGYLIYHAETDVLVNVLPVYGHGDGSVMGNRRRIPIEHKT